MACLRRDWYSQLVAFQVLLINIQYDVFDTVLIFPACLAPLRMVRIMYQSPFVHFPIKPAIIATDN